MSVWSLDFSSGKRTLNSLAYQYHSMLAYSDQTQNNIAGHFIQKLPLIHQWTFLSGVAAFNAPRGQEYQEQDDWSTVIFAPRWMFWQSNDACVKYEPLSSPYPVRGGKNAGAPSCTSCVGLQLASLRKNTVEHILVFARTALSKYLCNAHIYRHHNKILPSDLGNGAV